jgi:hypothetical protein
MRQSMSRCSIRHRVLTSLLLLVVSLASCRPLAPETTPRGPEITVSPGSTVSICAHAKGASEYVWSLQGEGQISISDGGRIVSYTAPEEGGIAILTVTAHNVGGTSPPTALTISPPAFVSLDQLVMMPCPISCDDNEQCSDLQISPTNCHKGSACLRFTYTPGGTCCGFLWRPLCVASATPPAVSPIPCWPHYVAYVAPGGECSVDMPKAGNLREASRLVFWVRGEQGGEMIEFGIGGPNMAPVPGRSTGVITLQPTWEAHEIDLRGLDLTRVEVLFRWLATDKHNPRGAVFYLDDVRFEGTRK